MAPASSLPSGGACSVTNSMSGCFALHQLLEGGGGRLSELEIRIDQRPALLLGGQRVGQHHRDLHVGRGAQAEGIAVAVLPSDLVGQRLGGEEEHLALAGELGDGETDVRQEGPSQDVHALAGDKLVGHPDGVARIGAVVARHHFELLAEHAALGVDLLDRHFPTLLVGIEEGRLRLVAVELADLDGVLRQRGTGYADGRGARSQPQQVHSRHHARSPMEAGSRQRGGRCASNAMFLGK